MIAEITAATTTAKTTNDDRSEKTISTTSRVVAALATVKTSMNTIITNPALATFLRGAPRLVDLFTETKKGPFQGQYS
jgi:hypothetical protein